MLTIVIPTYNRSESLSILLHSLHDELIKVNHKIEVIIGDNASTDSTKNIIERFKDLHPYTRIIRHEKNIGPDENFCSCIELVRTRYFWIIGDDDLPKLNVISKVMDIIGSERIDLLYMGSESLKVITGSSDGTPLLNISLKKLSRISFANKVNVWMTFISGMVVNLDRLKGLNPGINIRKYVGTNLVQLGWVLPLLMKGDNFFYMPENCLLATAENTGGYKLLTVFGKNLPRILTEECGIKSPERSVIIRALMWNFLPNFIWMCRNKSSSFFNLT